MKGLYIACAVVVFITSWWAAGHALIHKRDSRAALGWIGFCLIFPLLGPVSYWLFGINRIATRARKNEARAADSEAPNLPRRPFRGLSSNAVPPEFQALAQISEAVSGAPLLAGNHVEALHDGEQAYPAMLKAIEGATVRILLCTYIFDADEAGRWFVDALALARARGVEVRVILDGVGERYSKAGIVRLLRREGIEVVRFLPPRLLPPTLHLNLRNHRKILSVDGAQAFTGGMNLGSRHLAAVTENPDRVADLHFRLTGPIVAELEAVFARDWAFLTRELLELFPSPEPAWTALCRAIVDGPDEALGKLAMILVGALSVAQREVAIMTPYFLPPRELIAALQAAALRGVEVTLILPAKNNLFYVHWATRKLLWELLQRGIRVYYQPPPFVHSKLFLVDRHFCLVGSANLDPRSLRLNFELDVGVYDSAFGASLAEHFEAAQSRSREVTLEELDGRSLALRLRDGLAWLFSPYL